MKKVAIFVEGQSELIFVRRLLESIIDLNRLSYECFKLHNNDLRKVPYVYRPINAKVLFLIVNSQGDCEVLTAIKEREKYLFVNGYEKIIGLRDMYCDYYDKHSHSLISDTVSRRIIENVHKELKKMSQPEKIAIYFSIMELEAWFLSMYSVFPKINNLLSIEFIEDKLGYNLRDTDPQTKFYRPSIAVKKIFQLCGIKYDKSNHDIEMIMAKTDKIDFQIATENGRCRSLSGFYDELKTYDEIK